MKSVMNYSFAKNPQVEVPRSVFDRSHGYKTTFDASYLIPFYVDEALPGDTFNLRTSIFARMTTQTVPVMDNLHMETFYFAVPYRLIWENFKKFMGECDDAGAQLTEYLVPQCTTANGAPPSIEKGEVADYMGIPVGVNNIAFNALPIRAYSLIWNEWFRDQNLQGRYDFMTGDGPDHNGAFRRFPFRRNKRHDYFTSCLPYAQKGDAVMLPLGTTANVVGNGKSLGFSDGTTTMGLFARVGVGGGTNYMGAELSDSAYDINVGAAVGNGAFEPAAQKGIGLTGTSGKSGMVVDLTSATAATINSIRQAFQLQKLLERDARGGTRYTEIIKSHFGVTSPDARQQRPEYLGGSSSRIQVNPVQKTAEGATDTRKIGELGAYAYAMDNSGGFSKAFTEHCIIIGLVNVRADLTYQQGMERMWSRRTRYDHYLPVLANLGEQPVYGREIFCDGTAGDDSVFGYQERWAEYRHKPSKITGAFRSTFAQSLDVWHLSEEFGVRPELNDSFIQDKTKEVIDRVVAYTDENQFLFDAYLDLKCARCMPMYSIPGNIDHF